MILFLEKRNSQWLDIQKTCFFFLQFIFFLVRHSENLLDKSMHKAYMTLGSSCSYGAAMVNGLFAPSAIGKMKTWVFEHM